MLNKDAQILIVDDSKVVRLAVRRLLNGMGFENVTEAEDGADAVKIHGEGKTFGAIFMDIVMPNMNGDEALEKIRATDKTTPIIMLSSAASESQMAKCRGLGVVDFLVKPLVAETGAARISEVLAKI